MLKTARFKTVDKYSIINHVDYYIERVKEIPEGERYDYYVSNYVMKDELKVLQDFKEQDKDWKDTNFKVRRKKRYDFVRQNFIEKRIDFKCLGHFHSWVLDPAYENEVNEFFDLNYIEDVYCVHQRLSRLYFNPRTTVISERWEEGSVWVPDYIDQIVNEELMATGYLPYPMTYKQFLEVRDAEKAFLSRNCGHSTLQSEQIKTVSNERPKEDSSNINEVMKIQKREGRQRFKERKSAVKPRVSPSRINMQRGESKLQELELREVSPPILSYAETEFELWCEEEVVELAYTFPIEEVAVINTSQENPCCGEVIMFDIEIKKRELTQKVEIKIDGGDKKNEEESSTGVPALKVIGFVSESRLFEKIKEREKGPILPIERKKERWSRGVRRRSLIERRKVLKVLKSFRTDEFPVLKDVNDKPRCHLGNQVERLLLSRRVCVLL